MNAKSGAGKTPLHGAIWTGRYETASYLVTHGADLAARDSRGDTPLHVLAAFNLDEHGLLLKKDESRLKAADSLGSPREALLRLMIQKGADVNARNDEGVTPLQISVRNKRSITTQILRESGAEAGP